LVFDIIRSRIGHTRIADGSTLNLRVTVNGLAETEGPRLPTGPVFGVSTAIGIAVESLPNVKESVASKPIVPQDNSHFAQNIWEYQDIIETTPGFEEISYKASDQIEYLVRVEAEPTIVSRTMEYRDDFGNPVYVVRFSQKNSVSLKKG
jgi:hypothetical protein